MHSENEEEDRTPASAFEQVKSRAGACEVRSKMQIRETKPSSRPPFSRCIAIGKCVDYGLDAEA